MRKMYYLIGVVCFIAFLPMSQVSAQDSEIYDPFEEINRTIFAFNQKVDEAVIHPAIRGYRYITPRPARAALVNFLRNLTGPVQFLNQTLQGDLNGMRNVALRTSINTLVGFGGLMDTAAMEGIPYEEEDFGQTLAVWGVGHGPYIVMPFFGGVSLRDGFGIGVDAMSDPLMRYASNIDENHLNFYRFGLTYLTLRDSLHDPLNDLYANSFDPYSAVRSVYYQRRAALVADIGAGITSAPIAYNNAESSPFDDFY